jgi:hypothetical protein
MATLYLCFDYVELPSFHNKNKTIAQNSPTIDTKWALDVSKLQTQLGNKHQWQTPHRLTGDTLGNDSGPLAAVPPWLHTVPLRISIRLLKA